MAGKPDIDQFSSRRSTVYALNGLVATSQPLAAEAGVHILRSGGNAFDAAVATAAVLNVVEATSTGLGGDVFALYRTADGQVGGMQSNGGAPAAASIDRVRSAIAAERGGPAPDEVEMPTHGPHTVTVPGTARGWEAIIDRHGTLSFDDVLQPAIDYAIDGFPVSEVIADGWKQAETLFESEHARNTFLIDGRAPAVGETMNLPDLGDTFQSMARDGADVVYEGEVGEAIVEEVRSKGGLLSMDDLEAFTPKFVDPISTTYNGSTVFELPPPNQGLLVLEALNIAEALGVDDLDLNSPERYHLLVEAMKRAFHDGHQYVTDPEFQEMPDLNSKAYASRRAAEIGETATPDVTVGVPDSDTVLLTVGDAAGNLVSFINSRFRGFGSGLVAEGTGIALQNRGASFSLDRSHPNRLEPEKRPFHTLIPGMVRFENDDWAAFGLMGGPMQPQGHLQLMSQIIDYDHPLQAAIDEPRWQYLEDGSLAVEARLDAWLQTKLARRGHDLRVLAPQWFGGAQIVRDRQGTLSGASEPRKDGVAIGY